MSKKTGLIAIVLEIIILILVIANMIVVYGFFTEDKVKEDVQSQAKIENVPEDKTSQSEEKVEEIVKEEKNEENIVEEDVKVEETNKVENNENKSETVATVKNTKPEVSSRSKTVETSKSSTANIKKTSNNNVSNNNQNQETNKPKEEEKTQDTQISSNYKGYESIGIIEIPKTGVNLHILKYQTVGGMEIASCLLYSSGELNKSGNSVIVGHNYRNGKLFSNNNKLDVGDKIYITGLDGKKVTYTIYKKFETTEDDASFYKRETSGPEITLSTCGSNDTLRTVILAK